MKENTWDGGRNAAKAAGSQGREDILKLPPEALTLVTDKNHYLYQKGRVELPADEALARNLIQYGMLEPIEVTRDGSQLLIVYGRQRYKAAVLANEILKREKSPQRVLCRVMVKSKRTDQERLGVMASENALRVPMGPMEQAQEAQRMLNSGMSEAEVGVAFGLSAASVRLLTESLTLAPPVQQRIASGELPYTVAVRELSKLPRAEQEQAAMQLEGVKLNGHGARAKIREAANKAKGDEDGKTVRPGVKEIRRVMETANPDAKRILAWVIGEGKLPKSVRG